ncbi:sulfatase-like hydrolase/transferase [Flavisolibacter ginsenosidimutans]|uniref:Sulfatase-like hydrolase/transferase n=1 Tax=Flavisolibacter ginsenosidimutans TaxID=661481 RepID=A0A5B8UR82_9BACT|nr:sulfatase-like hydrolase/transferase [Flavisolibacter ginsenosidimutans]
MLVVLLLFANCSLLAQKNAKPNIVLIYTDDLGYGDISCNGSSAIQTPNIDKLAKNGVRFTNAHATSATCTPSRYSLLTGQYAWRKQGTGIAPGDASLLIPTTITTLPGMLKKAGYKNAVIGKWHLGLGGEGGPDWNGTIAPGPLEIGFDYSFLIPATGDRVPCVFVENHSVVNLDKNDPIKVSYQGPVDPDAPTGAKNPELLKMLPSHGHDQTIVNGVSRIGYMSGGKTALWHDEDFAETFLKKADAFITKNKSLPFFLYFATHDIHVPRLPNEKFVGKSGLGPRGDAILELDWTVGELYKILSANKLLENTLIIFTSDNGYVLNDGYKDDAVEKLGNHKAGGVYRGGKYSAFEAGTRVPMIVSWKGKVVPGRISNAMFSQIDFYASLAELTHVAVGQRMAPDSRNFLQTLLDTKPVSRDYIIEQSLNSTLSIIRDKWKYIEPSKGPAVNKDTNTELGNLKSDQLYDLTIDPGETNNLAEKYPAIVTQLKSLLEKEKSKTNFPAL